MRAAEPSSRYRLADGKGTAESRHCSLADATAAAQLPSYGPSKTVHSVADYECLAAEGKMKMKFIFI